MKVGIPAEVSPGERRVAGTPDTVKRLRKLGFEVLVQAGAGAAARYPDAAYEEAGASVVGDAAALWGQADIVIKVRPPTPEEVDRLGPGKVVISLLYPSQNEELVQRIAARGATAIALDRIPRISRAQKMDVLSSMANIAGYRAVVEAAAAYGSFFGGQVTAAGSTRPAQVLVIGAGVAGLAAIAAARGLGAEVRAFDVRPSVKEQVESLGARFLQVEIEEDAETAGGYAKEVSKAFIEAEMALFRQQAREVDVIITTALVLGKKAPTLVTRDMVESMKPGSVIVDLAAEAGGNCELTRPGEAYEHQGVQILGYTDLPSRLATHASQFFGTNIAHLLHDMTGEEGFRIDLDDVVVRAATIVHEGEVLPPPPPVAMSVKKAEPAAPAPAAPAPKPEEPAEEKDRTGLWASLAVLAIGALGWAAPSEFLQHLTVFVLAVFVGWRVIWAVTPALHTPLMSVTNAISGIIVIGGMLQAATGGTDAAAVLGAVAVLVASINIFGGFLVTRRMLSMFRREEG